MPKLNYAMLGLFYIFFSTIMTYFIWKFKLKKEIHT